MPQEGPPNKKPKNDHDAAKKEKRNKSPVREHKKSDCEVTVEVRQVMISCRIVNVRVCLGGRESGDSRPSESTYAGR